MPVLTFSGGRMENEAKTELIRELTLTASRVTGIPTRFMTVFITENDDTNIGLGGETLLEFKARLENGQH